MTILTKPERRLYTTFSGEEISGGDLGTITMCYTVTIPKGWLECNGATFSEEDYPGLARYLGKTTLPDFREAVPCGVGHRDLEMNHDEYTLEEFKNDIYPVHTHTFTSGQLVVSASASTNTQPGSSGAQSMQPKNGVITLENNTTSVTTHGNRFGVKFIIKAV